MYRKITQDTSTESLIALEDAGRSAKPFLCELAQEVFRKEDGEKRIDRRVLHAYSQFSSKQLAKIIDAKREGVFDYGLLIEEVPGGYRYPKAEDALRLLKEATSGPTEQEDLVEVEPTTDIEINSTETPLDSPEAPTESPTDTGEGMDKREQRKIELEGMNKRPLQQLHLAVTGSRSKRGEAAEHLIERILDVEFGGGDTTEEAVANATTSKLENAMAEDPQVREEPFDPRPAGPKVVVNTFSAKEEEEKYQAEQEDNIVKADFAGKNTEEPDAENDEYQNGFAYENSVLSGLRGIFVTVDILRRNLDVLANEILPHGIQSRNWNKAPPEIIADYDALSEYFDALTDDPNEEDILEPDLEEIPVEETAPSTGGSEAADEMMAAAAVVMELAKQESEYSEDEIFAKNYTGKFLTLEELQRLDTETLYEYATQAGIENARAQAFTPVLRRHVLKRLNVIKSIKESLGQSV